MRRDIALISFSLKPDVTALVKSHKNLTSTQISVLSCVHGQREGLRKRGTLSNKLVLNKMCKGNTSVSFTNLVSACFPMSFFNLNPFG